jgi:hypothetical protein
MMIISANPVFEDHIDLPGKHVIKEISLKGDLSNSRIESHSHPKHIEYIGSVSNTLVITDFIPELCQERFLYESEFIEREDITRIHLKWEHVHDGFYEEPLLGARHLKIVSDVGVFDRDINLSGKRNTQPVKVDIPKEERSFEMGRDTIISHHVDFTVDRYQKTLVEFWFFGHGNILVYGESILETDKTYKTLNELRVEKEIKPNWDRPQKFRMVIPSGGNQLRMRWNPQNSEDEDFRVKVYDVKIVPIYSKQENVSP